MATPRTRNPRGAGSQLRGDLVAAAADLLDEQGETALTMRAVTRRVGVAPQSIYAHFADREQLLWAVLTEWFTELETFIDAADPAETPSSAVRDAQARLRARAHAYCTYGLTHPRRYQLLLTRQSPVIHDLALDAFPAASLFRGLQTSVATFLESGTGNSDDSVELGHVDGQRAFLATTDLLATLHGAIQLRIGLPSFPWPAIDGVIDRTLPRILM